LLRVEDRRAREWYMAEAGAGGQSHGRHHSVRPERCFRSVVRYSVLHGNEQLFASKYKLVLPSKEELRAELKREQRLLENSSESGKATKARMPARS